MRRADIESSAAEAASELVALVGGRWSRQLGIDVDAGSDQVERWFLAATLSAAPAAPAVAARVLHALRDAGIVRIAQVRRVRYEELRAVLRRNGYARVDERVATRLRELADAVDARFDGEVAAIGAHVHSPPELEMHLEELPGWGPVTTELFLRELRGVWPAADPPLDPHAERAAEHLGIIDGELPALALVHIRAVARDAGLDVRDLEAALVRFGAAHHDKYEHCPGGRRCRVLVAAAS
jgi:endonuclease III